MIYKKTSKHLNVCLKPAWIFRQGNIIERNFQIRLEQNSNRPLFFEVFIFHFLSRSSYRTYRCRFGRWRTRRFTLYRFWTSWFYRRAGCCRSSRRTHRTFHFFFRRILTGWSRCCFFIRILRSLLYRSGRFHPKAVFKILQLFFDTGPCAVLFLRRII